MFLHTRVLVTYGDDDEITQELRASFKLDSIIAVEEYIDDPSIDEDRKRHSKIYLSNGMQIPLRDSYHSIMNKLIPPTTPPLHEEDLPTWTPSGPEPTL